MYKAVYEFCPKCCLTRILRIKTTVQWLIHGPMAPLISSFQILLRDDDKKEGLSGFFNAENCLHATSVSIGCVLFPGDHGPSLQ